MANRDMAVQQRLATDSNAKNPVEEKRNDSENNREDLTISPNHAGRKGIMKNKILELYDPKNLIVK